MRRFKFTGPELSFETQRLRDYRGQVGKWALSPIMLQYTAYIVISLRLLRVSCRYKLVIIGFTPTPQLLDRT